MLTTQITIEHATGISSSDTLSVLDSPTHLSRKLQRRQRAGERAKYEDDQYVQMLDKLVEMDYKFNLASDSNIQLVDNIISVPCMDSSINGIATLPDRSYRLDNNLSINDTAIPVRRSSLLNGSPTLAINENTNESVYSRRFWKTSLVAKDHQNYIGEMSTLGWGCVSIIKESDNSRHYTAFIRTDLKFMTVHVPLTDAEGRLGDMTTHEMSDKSPYANFSKLFRAFIIYKERLQKELSRATETVVVSEREMIYNYLSLVQKFDPVQAAMGLELVEDARITPALKNLEGQIVNQSVSVDVVLTHPLEGGLERIQAAESFLDICGEPLVAPALLVHIEKMASSYAPSLQAAENRKERKEEIIRELLETERNYLHKINALIEIRSMVLDELQRTSDRYYVNAIFYNISNLARVSQTFIKALEQTFYEEVDGNVVSIQRSYSAYQSYLLNYDTAIEQLRQFQNKHKSYKSLLKRARNLKSCDRLSVTDLLVQPVQRIPRYALIITNLLRYTHVKHPDHAQLVSILATVDSIGSLHGYQDKDRLTQLNDIRATVHGCPEQLLSASRTFIAQMEVSEIEPATFAATRPITLFLFCDTLLFAERTSSGLRFLAWTSILDLSLTSVGKQNNSSGFYLRYDANDTDADGYWSERTIRQYSAHSEFEGQQFRMIFYDNWAALRMKVNNCKTYVQSYNKNLQVYINIYDTQDLYDQAVYKNDTKLFYVDMLTPMSGGAVCSQATIPILGVIQPCRNDRFRLLLKSRVNTCDTRGGTGYNKSTANATGSIYHQIPCISRRLHDINSTRLLFIERVAQGQQEICNTFYYLQRQMAYNNTWLSSVKSLKLAAQPIVLFTQMPGSSSSSSRLGRRDYRNSSNSNISFHKTLQPQYLTRITSNRLARVVSSMTSRDGWSGRGTAFRSTDAMISRRDAKHSTDVTDKARRISFGREIIQNRRVTLNFSKICETGKVVRPEGSWVDLRRSDSNSSRSTHSSSSRSQRSLERLLRSTWDSVCTAVGDIRDRRASSFMGDSTTFHKK
ncbi:hypothetical protein BDF22DRAFT_664766 [Syncephalis plumigaleata]|nr:hypothetical protein BDF22DRAFT_664766 [Syncephalis plumigaleata]